LKERQGLIDPSARIAHELLLLQKHRQQSRVARLRNSSDMPVQFYRAFWCFVLANSGIAA